MSRTVFANGLSAGCMASGRDVRRGHIILVAFAVSLALPAARAAIVQTPYSDDNAADLTLASQTSAGDLINAGQPTLATVTTNGLALSFGTTLAAINDGAAWPNGAHLPSATASSDGAGETWEIQFDLALSAGSAGYSITEVQTFAAFPSEHLARRANQTYGLYFSLVGDPSFALATSVAIGNSGDSHETRMTITDTTGVIATGVDAIRFAFSPPPGAPGASNSTIWRELDVFGFEVVGAIPEPATGLLALAGLALAWRRRGCRAPRA
ncbi:MAG: hypothetical protein BWZ02_02325 [Lentisphaerae bacterium ADurb.BinA184]|nr:MAG: hypothetical protein BWZ02_02325 [Lentisphaerae bacterium ADurb.BinA184]